MSSQYDCGNNPNAANCRWDYGTHSAFPYPLFLCLGRREAGSYYYRP
jgi:hypothetical protein